MSEFTVNVQLLSLDGVLPVREAGSVGYDLFAAGPVTIGPHGKVLVPTDIALEIPEGTYGRIAPRSGMSWRGHTSVGAGVIDPSYRGNVQVLLFNHSPTETVRIARHDRVAQIIFEVCRTPVLRVNENLSSTARGAGGFGSTGS